MSAAQNSELNQAQAAPSASERLVDQLANRIGGLGVELADVAGNLQEVAGRVSGQSDRFGHLQKTAETMVSANHGIASASQAVQTAATAAVGEITQSRAVVETAVQHIAQLIEAVGRIEHRLSSVGSALTEVAKVSGSIEAIAVNSLIGESGEASLRAKNAGEGAAQIQSIIARVQNGFTAVGSEIDGVAKAATSNLEHCDRVIDELGNLARGVDLSSTELKHADDRVAKLLDISEGLIALIADSAVETSDAPLIRVVVDTAKQISAAFETAVARGEIGLDQLMDEKYREIAGTDPKQYMTEYVTFTDRILPPIQDPVQKCDPRIVFCVAWARGGYLPTHNPNYRHKQGPDPVWNNANCRNRRLFSDRAVKKVAANTRPFLLQTYRRDMGGGNFVLMKDLSSPIVVRGRHWGAFRMGFRQS